MIKRVYSVLAVTFLVIVTSIGFWYSDDKKSPENESSIAYTIEEAAWLEDHAASSVFYYVDRDQKKDVEDFVRYMSLLSKLSFESVSEETSADMIFYGDGYETQGSHGNLIGPVVLNKATYYSGDAEGPEGMLSSEVEGLLDFRTESTLLYSSMEALIVASQMGEIGGFWLLGLPQPLTNEDGEFFEVKSVSPLTSGHLWLALPQTNATKKSVIKKTAQFILDEALIDDAVIQMNEELFGNHLMKNLTEEEAAYLKDKKFITVGVVESSPWIINRDDDLYGIVIGYMKQFSRTTGLDVTYITGEKAKLLEAEESYDIDLLWLDGPTERMIEGEPFMNSDYVIVGQGSRDHVLSLVDLRYERIGALLSDSHVLKDPGVLSSTYYYGSIEEMVRDHLKGDLAYILMSRAELLYCESVLGYEQLDVQLTLDKEKTPAFYYGSNDVILMTIMNKVYSNVDQQGLINSSLEGIPEEEAHGFLYWQIMGVFLALVVMIALFIFGAYRLNIREERQMNYLLTHDQLTNLPNRYGLRKYVDTSIDSEEQGFLLMIDIDHMKAINDRLGHALGDQTILEFSRCLMELTDKKNLLGRSGGDEFLLVLKDREDEALSKMIETIHGIAERYRINRQELYDFSVSIVVTSYPDYKCYYDQLYTYLEYTMDTAKASNGVNLYKRFSYDLYETYLLEQDMIKEIQIGLERDEFVLYIQPQVQMPEEKIIGGEILVRWQHPKRGLLYPDAFLPVAEKNGLMRDIDYYVMEKSARLVNQWQSKYEYLKISVNMSTETFEDKDLQERLEKIVQDTGTDTSWMVIEVTEDMGFENMERANEIFESIRTMGFCVALDDFGKGYSSLSYLENLSFDILKIDKALVDHIHLNDKALVIFNTIVEMSRIMASSVVFEGVEYEEQVALLKGINHSVVQGYYYYKPMTLGDFEDLDVYDFGEKTL